MHACRFKQIAWTILLSAEFAFVNPVFAQSPEAKNSESTPTADCSASDDDKPVVFPLPTADDGAELLRYENISFEADTTPMPEIAATVRSARKNKYASAMFMTHMMYRDHVNDIAYYNKGRKQNTELTSKELHREMIRWRDLSSDAGYELAILATNPSVQYEISPLFSNDDEFKSGLNWLKKAAARGYGNAEYILGLVYFNGVGVKRDKKKGFELLVRAAAHGVINAYYAVGMIYEMGLNGKKDTDKSLYWLEKAARYGSKDALFILAMKYYDGIDVPKDEVKAEQLEKQDLRYHAWIKLHQKGRDKFYQRFCTFKFDESSIGWSEWEGGGCEGYKRVSYVEDTFSVAGKKLDDFDDEEVTAQEFTADEVATLSLEYKIDYRLAALWLKKVANIDRENTYILRAQTRHITGCKGGLDGLKFEKITELEGEDIDQLGDSNHDDFTRSYKIAMIALNDDKLRPSKVLKWLNEKAESGDLDACKTLGRLYEFNSDRDYDKNEQVYDDYKEVYEYHWSDYEYYSTLFEERYSYNDLAMTLKIIKINHPKAFEYYQKAEAFGDARRVALKLGNKAYKNKKYEDADAWFSKAVQMSESWFQNVKNNPNYDKMILAEDARRVGNAAYLKGDDAKAVEWYKKAVEMIESVHIPSKYKESIQKNILVYSLLLLAGLYDTGHEQVKNVNNAIAAYRKLLLTLNKYDGEPKHDWSTSAYWPFGKITWQTALRLAHIYYDGTETISPNQKNAIPLFYYAVERYTSMDKDNPNPDAMKFAMDYIESQPKLNLMPAVEKQILAEKDKNPEDFFVIKEILPKCDDDYGEGGAVWKKCSSELLSPYYDESIKKAIRAITALSIASGSKHSDEIKNTFYYIAIFKGNDFDYCEETLSEMSAVYHRLHVESLWAEKNYNGRQLFHIWYLRQIPFAAADEFKKLKLSKSWNEYLNEADKLIEQDEQLRTAFGYDPAREVQKLRFPDELVK